MGKWKKRSKTRGNRGGSRSKYRRSKTRRNGGRKVKTRATKALKSKDRHQKQMMRASQKKLMRTTEERGFRRRELQRALAVPLIQLPSVFFDYFPGVSVGGKFGALLNFPEDFSVALLGLGARGF